MLFQTKNNRQIYRLNVGDVSPVLVGFSPMCMGDSGPTLLLNGNGVQIGYLSHVYVIN